MKILFLTHSYPNYVPDLLLHGLRKLLGPAVVDYPRKDCLYEGVLGLGVCPEDQRCPGWFPAEDPACDRQDVWRKVVQGYYDLVLCDLRALPLMTKHLNQWPQRCVLIDGEDSPQYLAPGPYVVCRRETDGSDYSLPLPMGFPEELLSWISRYDAIPKQYSIGFLGSTHDGERRRLVEMLAASYPGAMFQATDVPSPDNPFPGGRLGRDAYYRTLQQCRMVLSLAGAGYDTFRFWENAACNALHLCMRSPLYLPDDFVDGREILRFSTVQELRRKLEPIIADQNRMQDIISMGRRKLVQKHLTQHRARYLLDRVRRSFQT